MRTPQSARCRHGGLVRSRQPVASRFRRVEIVRPVLPLWVERDAAELAGTGVEHPVVTEGGHRSCDSRNQAEGPARRAEFGDEPDLASGVMIDRGELRPPGERGRAGGVRC